jgi:hypothetical protein
MSTRCTIGYDTKNFHLYEECFDKDKIYLELNDDCFEVVDSFFSKESREITVGIEITTWRKVVESWINSHWGKNPDLDYKEPKINTSYMKELIENSLLHDAKEEIKKVEK